MVLHNCDACWIRFPINLFNIDYTNYIKVIHLLHYDKVMNNKIKIGTIAIQVVAWFLKVCEILNRHYITTLFMAIIYNGLERTLVTTIVHYNFFSYLNKRQTCNLEPNAKKPCIVALQWTNSVITCNYLGPINYSRKRCVRANRAKQRNMFHCGI